MSRKLLLILLSLILLLSACIPRNPQQAPAELPGTPAISTPGLEDKPVNSKTPEPGEVRSLLEPIPGEEKMIRGQAFIEESDLLTLESFPVQIVIAISGNLPTPCHQLRATVVAPDADNRIDVEVFTLVDPDMICIQMLQPFTEQINLGSFASGKYQLYLNGELVGEFTS